MNVFAKFDEILSMILQDIKETKRYGHMVGHSDNVKTVYPPTNIVCGGYNQAEQPQKIAKCLIFPINTEVGLYYLCICM